MSKGKFVFAQLVANLDDDKFRISLIITMVTST